MKTKLELAREIRTSPAQYVTYGESDLGIPVSKGDALFDILNMDDEMIGDGTWYMCDKTGQVIDRIDLDVDMSDDDAADWADRHDLYVAHDDMIIWGIGLSPEDAIEDSKQWLDHWNPDILKTGKTAKELAIHFLTGGGGDVAFDTNSNDLVQFSDLA